MQLLKHCHISLLKTKISALQRHCGHLRIRAAWLLGWLGLACPPQ
jgi:hypothetical protein